MASEGDVVGQAERREPAARRIRLAPTGFWSYARQDDLLSQGKLNELRSLLMSELQQLYGREQITLFQDLSTIPHGAAWETEVRTALDQSTFFVAIITPNFIQSEWCTREVELFAKREAQLREIYPDLSNRRRILPIHYIDVTDIEPADPKVAALLQELQWFDFRSFRHRSFDNDQVREAISELARGMRDLLNIKVEDPAVAEARARAEAEEVARAAREAEVQAAQAREQEAQKRREAALKKAEESRKAAEEAAAAARKLAEEAAEMARMQAAQADEAARLLAAEEAAAEQARQEAAAAAQRLSAPAADAAQKAAEEAARAVERARAEQEAAARVRNEAEAAAARAQADSEALARREQQLAEAVAVKQQALVSPQPERNGLSRHAVTAAGVAALGLAAYLLWPASTVTPPADTTGPATTQSEPTTTTTSTASTPAASPIAWLDGSWGMDGDCNDPVTISRVPAPVSLGAAAERRDQLRVTYGGANRDQRIMSGTPDLVVTDVARYVRQGDGVQVSEAGEVSRIDYRLTACAAR